MKFNFRHYQIALFWFLSAALLAEPVGWYAPILIDNNVHSYRLFYPANQTNDKIYFVSEKIVGEFNQNQPTKLQIFFNSFNGEKNTSEKVADILLEKSPALFPLHASVAMNSEYIVIIWQETSVSLDGNLVKYVFKKINQNSFSLPRDLKINDITKFSYFLPQLKTNAKDQILVFFQDEKKDGRFSMAQATFDDGVFIDVVNLIEDVKSIGRGAFFPSVAVQNKNLFLVYQNRDVLNFRDELFLLQSGNHGSSYEAPLKLTENEYNDYSPFILAPDQLEIIWQANPKANWSIFYKSGTKNQTQITTTNANTYNPTFIPIANKRLFSWHDFRDNPSQIYARLSGDGNENDPEITKEHNVSVSKVGAKEPKLIGLRNRNFLFYIEGKNLVARMFDQDTETLKISSKTHLPGVSANDNNPVFEWTIPQDPSAVEGFAYLVDGNELSQPEIFSVAPDRSSIKIESLNAGKYFFHLRYKDKAGNFSATSRYPFFIDNVKPTRPVLSSTTHKERVATKEKTVKFNFSASDDTGIGRYLYVLSPNRAAKLDKATDKNELTLFNVRPNSYYFMVQAEDKAGNLSEVATYQIEILPSDEDMLQISSNIFNSELQAEEIQVTIKKKPKQKISSCQLFLGSQPEDPFDKGSVCELTETADEYKLNYALKKKENGLYVLSLGFLYEDGSRSPLAQLPFQLNLKKDAVNEEFNRQLHSHGSVTISFSDLLPEIMISRKMSVYEVAFDIQPTLRPYLKGYSYVVSERIIFPDSEINSSGGPEFLLDLQPGKYHLTVAPVFKDSEAKKRYDKSEKKIASFVIIVPTEGFWDLTSYRFYLGLAVFLILLFFMRRRLYYYWSKLHL